MNFKEYLKENKQKLELDSVNPEIWLSVENKILRQKNRRQVIYLKILAASAAVLVGVILMIGLPKGKEPDLETELLKVYGLEKYEFTQQVSQRTELLADAKIPVERKEDFAILLNQLEFLDAQYHDYLQYVEQNGYQDFIGKQILQYYKSKIELLDKIQNEIEKINYYENKFPTNSPTVELDI